MPEMFTQLLGSVEKELLEFRQSDKFYFVLGAVAIGLVIPFAASEYVVGEVLTPMIIFMIYASSWNLLAYSGQGSLGHAAFLGIGGFASALLAIKLGLPPVFGLLVGSLFSAGIGLLIGLVCVRLKAWFLAMVTFGFSVIIVTLISQFDSVIGGVMGFPTPLIIERGLPFYYLTFVLAAISIGVMYLLIKSKTGLAFRAIHENEPEAKMIGINIAKYKLLAFVLSTFFAGLAGGLFAQSIRYIQVSVFDPYYSFLPLMMAVIGGLRTIEGPLIGSVIIVTINSYLYKIDDVLQGLMGPLFPNVSNVGPPLRMLSLGLFLVLVVIFLPKGISSLLPKIREYFSEKPKKGENT
jgi:branched-chain amino acid transport system permease protein